MSIRKVIRSFRPGSRPSWRARSLAAVIVLIPAVVVAKRAKDPKTSSLKALAAELPTIEALARVLSRLGV